MKILIIIPAYNVEGQISEVLDYVNEKRLDAIVVNDGSTDNTKKVISKYNVPSISIETNSGVSNAILLGVEYGLKNGYTHIITIDSDGQHSPTKLQEFSDLLNDFDFVFGNRFYDVHGIPTCKLAANSLVSAFYKEAFGKWIPDISCGYKGYRITPDLYNYLKKDKSYSIVFSVVNYAVCKGTKMITLPVECIYSNNSFLSTRRIEILSFLDALRRFDSTKLDGFEYIQMATERKKDFEVSLFGIEYYAFYVERNDSYLVQADVRKIIELYE